MFQNNGFQGFQAGNEYGERAQFVASDLLVAESDLTFAEFQTAFALQKPSGFGDFVSFLAGDHEYKKAAIRLEVTSDGSSLPSISQLDAIIDVPDVFDLGVGVVSASGELAILFNRSFYIAPEVICSIKSGTTFVVPRTSNVTRTGFTVQLRDKDNNPVAGTVTWSAHGY